LRKSAREIFVAGCEQFGLLQGRERRAFSTVRWRKSISAKRQASEALVGLRSQVEVIAMDFSSDAVD
jgi:hypothetical protein